MNKNKKSKINISDFMMVYGWAILVVLVAIGALAYFGIFNPENFKEQPINTTKEVMVCNNLEKLDNTTLHIYPEIINRKNLLEADWYFRIVDIKGNTSIPRQWDNNGVMCQMNAEMCTLGYTYCLDIKIIIPVNYTEWDTWYNE